VLLEKHNPPAVYDSEETLELAQENEIFPIVNQVDVRVRNFEIQFLKEAAKFVREFKSLAKEADESLAKHKALELEIERLLRAVVSQDIMSIVQNPSVVDSSNLQTKIERTKERFENCIIKKENEYAKPCYDWLRAQLFDKVSGKNDTNRGTSANTNFAKQSILGKPPSSSRHILYAVTPLPKSMVFPKVGETNALSNQVTSNSVPSSQESNIMKNNNVLSPGIFSLNPFKASRLDNLMPNKHVKASIRTKPNTVSQPHVITKNDVNSKTNGFSPKDVKSTTWTRRPQPRNNPKNDKVPYMSKSSWLSNNLKKIEENHRNLQSSSNQKHMSSEFNNIKFAIQKAKSEIVCAMCKQFLITVNHDVCVLNYVNGMNSRGKKQKEPISRRFPYSSFSMTGGQNWFETLLIPLLSMYKQKDKEDHGDNKYIKFDLDFDVAKEVSTAEDVSTAESVSTAGDQDSLNAAASGNLLEKSPQDALTIIENKSKVRNSRSKPIASSVNACNNHSSSELAKLTHAVNQQTSAVTTVMTAMLKQFQSNPPPALVKAGEEICVTCGGAHPYYQCLAAGGNTFPEYRDNIQGYVSAATRNFNQGKGYDQNGTNLSKTKQKREA
nr:hypothetical protein [Tanacetum cinerariifolium]